MYVVGYFFCHMLLITSNLRTIHIFLSLCWDCSEIPPRKSIHLFFPLQFKPNCSISLPSLIVITIYPCGFPFDDCDYAATGSTASADIILSLFIFWVKVDSAGRKMHPWRLSLGMTDLIWFLLYCEGRSQPIM